MARRGCRSEACTERSGRILVGMWCWMARRGRCTRGEAPQRHAHLLLTRGLCCDPRERFSTCPRCRITRLGSHHFCLLLLRRFQLLLPLIVRSCWCGCPLDAYGHHRAACAWGRGLGEEGVRSGECGGPNLHRSGWPCECKRAFA